MAGGNEGYCAAGPGPEVGTAGRPSGCTGCCGGGAAVRGGALAAMGGGEVVLSWLGVPMTVTSTDDVVSVAFRAGWQPFAVSAALGALGVALGARVWRLWRRVPA